MTKTTKTIFEKYEIRKTKKQKSAFIGYVKSVADANGYAFRVEKGSFGARNIVIGDPETAKVIYTAHYDTCPRLPFPNFITPKNFLIYFLYQIAISVLFIILPISALTMLWRLVLDTMNVSENARPLLMLLGFYAFLIGIMALLMAGPANKHTANDNTSGITTLLDLMTSLPNEQKHHVCFVFFDLEEMGLFGSSSFANKHKNAMKTKLLLNFDCVSDGEHILFALKKGAIPYQKAIKTAFADNGYIHTEVLSKGVFYPSDQANFPRGVGIAALKKSKKTGLLYMARIHTPRDTIYREENIAFLVNGAKKLLEII